MQSTATKETTMEKARITRATESCTCGCRGRDTWHRRSYDRALRDERAEVGVAEETGLGVRTRYTRVATARFPWGESRVVLAWLPIRIWDEEAQDLVTTGHWCAGWTVDRGDALRVQNG